ncbi:coiled-coil and C2 domain-containing protein 2A-like isoform X4 [Convolutriloba macropyga]|uniref:coiled-coil and C2 domain-containing protein 2A-like isoform X4 n=1 Tax=Convolutriloba macropyga TaxID=536237 RepID=UPI003F51F172
MAVEADQLTDDEVREGEELKRKLQKKHKKTVKKLGTLEDSQDFGASKEITIKRPKKARKPKTDQEHDEPTEGETASVSRDERPERIDDTASRVDRSEDAPDSSAVERPTSSRTADESTAVGDDTSEIPEIRTDTAKPSKHKAALQKKLQAKLDKVKETKRAEESESVAQTTSVSKRLRSLRGKSMVTRFETEEEIARGEELEKTLKTRSRFREAVREAKKKFEIPSEQECYDFFTKTWDDPADLEEPEKEEPAVVEEVTGEEGGEVKVKTAATLFDLDSIVLKRPPEYVPNRKRLEDEESRYFVPTMRPAEDGYKLPEGQERRFLEEEGLYVGEKPLVSLRNVNKMEQRILKEDDRPERWFAENGHLVMCSDPLKHYPTKPIIYSQEELEPELQTVYVKASASENDSRYIDGRVSESSVGKYQLSIEIPDITFTHHPLYTREHVLAGRLSEAYEEYASKTDKNVADHYSDKLVALRDAIRKVQDSLRHSNDDQNSHSEILTQQLQARLNEYMRELKRTRELRDKEDRNLKEKVKLITKTWKQIRSERQQNGYTSTNVKLLLEKEDANKELDLLKWKADIEAEVEEERMFFNMEHQVALAKYKFEHEQWAKQEAKMRKIRQKKKERMRKINRIEDEEAMLGDTTAGNANDDQETSSSPEPVAPQPFDEDKVRQEITDKYLKIRRKPGEPKIVPVLTKGATIAPLMQCPPEEKGRRNEIKNSKYLLKVLYNGKEVSQTTVKSMSDSFVVQFQQNFNIVIVQWPESVVVQLLEGGFSRSVVSEIELVVPDAAVNTSNVSLDQRIFSSDQVVSTSNAGVGSGKEVMLSDNESVLLKTKGTLTCSIAWALSPDGTPLVPMADNTKTSSAMNAMKLADPISAIGSSGHLDMPALVEWVNQNRLDPNDPANSTILYHVKMYTDGAVGENSEKPEYFRLEQLQEEFDFCKDEELNTNRRFRLLEYRSQEVPEFRNYRMVPASQEEISPDFFDDYERKMAQEMEELSGGAMLDQQKDPYRPVEEEMDEHRILVNKIRKRVYENVLVRFIQARHQYTITDVVHEETIPDTALLGEAIKKFFEPRRPLRPQRKERKAVTAPNLSGADVRILVNIISATHLPVRKDVKTLQEEGFQSDVKGGEFTDNMPLDQLTWTEKVQTIETYLRPFVEVSFRDVRKSTSAAASYSPTWNEEIAIPFSAPNNDYSPSNLQTIDDVLYFNVFDQIHVDLVEDDRDRATTVHHRLERRWLGSIKIPFGTIYYNSKIEGVFRLSTPPVLLGYRDSRELELKASGLPEVLSGAEEEIGSGKQGSYISLFATIEPPLAPAEPVKEQFESREDPELIRYAHEWQTALEKSFPKRSFVCIVVDIQGQSVFVSRYVKKLAPPEGVNKAEGDMNQYERVARFVANIPFVSDNLAFPGVCDIWSTCDQFMTMLAGDEEEHAVLLCNYFLHLGLRAYLLMGNAIPEGATAYVLAFHEGNPRIWNPFTGVCYTTSDPFCPLLSVGSLIDESNVYANVQAFDEPYRVDFNISDEKKWRPFFGSKFRAPPSPLASVQPESLVYEETSEDRRLQIQDRIERKVRDKLMEWRPRYVTRWNRHCQIKFRDLLPKLESSRTSSNNQKHQESLKAILDQHQVSGFPINMPLTTMQAILDEVHSTGVHLAPGSDVEFALAVYLHAYPNSVFSVWVYVACLSRRSSAPPQA